MFRGDAALYDAYRTYWEDLARQEADRHYNRIERTDSATVYFSPRSDFDTHLKALENVVPPPDATILFAYSIWTTKRSAVVDRLEELVDQGCTAEVILEEGEGNVASKLREAGAAVIEYPREPLIARLLPVQTPNVHSKNMLIDAEFDEGGETVRRRRVYTGSQNLSGAGLVDNDDVLLRIEDDAVFDRFARDWERVYEQGRKMRRR